MSALYVIGDTCQSPSCHRMGADMRTCSGCRQAHYCSAQCQKNDWKSHKILCKNNSKEKARARADTEAAKAHGGEAQLDIPRLFSDLKQWTRTQRPLLTWAAAHALQVRSNPSNASTLCLKLDLERTSCPVPPGSFKLERMSVVNITEFLSLVREKSPEQGETCDEVLRRAQAATDARTGARIPLVFILTGPLMQIVPVGFYSEGSCAGLELEDDDDWQATFKRILLGW
ncbi:hypothetical protein JB92DRAFT_3114109 [Gautieria morchelliformis]|nr:hypothetical protein JB92DRAFT_3114109 [Gautieria morchelliformis]